MYAIKNPIRALQFEDNDSIQVVIAPNAGACFGVERAIKLAEKAVESGKIKQEKVFSIGPLIHNPMVINRLEADGLVTLAETAEIENGTAVIRSHGIKKNHELVLKKRGIRTVDATCPLVKKPQRIAAACAQKNYYLVIVGDANHPEIKGVASYYGLDSLLITYNPDDVINIPNSATKIAVLAQTTIEVDVFDAIVKRCRERFSDVIEYNTICDATSVRQSEAHELSHHADVIIVVGGKNSSNTKKLEKICKQHQLETYLIENEEELNPEWFLNKKKIAVFGGASTPQDYVDQIGQKINSFSVSI